MKSAYALVYVVLLWCSYQTSASGSLPDVKRVTVLPTVNNRYIVEVDSVSEIPSNQIERKSLNKRVLDDLKVRGVSFQVDKEFHHAGVFVGAAVTLTSAQDVSILASISGVKAIRPVRKLSIPEPINVHVVTGLDDPAIPPDSESTHTMTGVDKLHAENITGAGIKIGILDTGIDYTHPALGGGFGPGHKVIGGFDLVGDDYDGSNTPVPDPDPLDQCNGHGTHVAGIIGADPLANPFNISGVAFSASISSYRIFGCTGFVTDDIIIDALLMGVQDGQDILTLSLGGADGWTESTASVVASRIASMGKIVTIAAGNDASTGASGSWYTSSPGNGIDVISVASVDNIAVAMQSATVEGASHAPIDYFQLFPFTITGPLPIFPTSNDTTVIDDACDPLPDSTPDLSGFVVIIRRGTCTFVQKLTNVAAKGGNFALIYDNGSGFNPIDVGNFNASLIQAADGEFLVSEFVTGVSIALSFPQTGGLVQVPDTSTGGLVSSFSSYGPSDDFFFKPAIAAPGGNILSTLPVPLGSYGIESGTSMATPFLAGSSALLLSVKGKSSAVTSTARTLFQTTAMTIPSSLTDGDPLQTVTQQGAGLINVFDAIHATTIVSPGELILNDTAHFNGVHTFTVKNIGSAAKTYTLRHVPAGTAITVSPGTIFPADGPVPFTSDHATVTLSRSSFTVRPGETETITARFTPPSGVDATSFPLYSGFIQIANEVEKLHVSYIGLAASLIDKQVVDNTDAFFGVSTPAILDSAGNIQVSPTNYTFDQTTGDFPTLLFRLAFGTPVFRVDLVDPNTTFKPTINTRASPEPFLTFPHQPGGSFSRVRTIGPLMEIDHVTRNNDIDNTFFEFAFDTPTFSNGTVIPDGSYKFLVRALRVAGNPSNEADYESWLSPIVGIVA